MIAFHGNPYSKGKDFAFKQVTEFKLKKKKGDLFKLETKTDVEVQYLSKRSTKHTQFSIPDPYYSRLHHLSAKLRGEKVEKHRIRIEKPQRKDVFMHSDRIHVIDLKDDIMPGNILTYEYRQDYEDAAFFPIVKLKNADIGEYDLIIKHPKEVTVEFEFFYPWGELEHSIERPGEKETHLSFRRLAKRKALRYFPYNDILAAIMIKYKRDDIDINPSSLVDFVDWYSGLVDLNPVFSDTLSTELDDELNSTASSYEKLSIINRWIRDNIRYVAEWDEMGAIVPSDPSFVHDNGYGDCKDRAYLASAIARRLGMDVNMALVSTKIPMQFDGIHVTLYDHVICTAENKGEILFFDPTAKYLEFGDLHESIIGSNALVLDIDKPQIVRIDPIEKSPAIDINIHLSHDSPAEGKARVTLHNDYYAGALHALKEYTEVKMENYLSNLVTEYLYQISIDGFVFNKKTDRFITFDALADMSKFIVSTGSKIYIPKSPFNTVDNKILDRNEDDLPLYFDDRDHIRMLVGFKADSRLNSPDSLSVMSSDGGAFLRSSITPGDSSIAFLEYEYSRYNRYAEHEDKERLIGFFGECLDHRNEMFIIERGDQ
jgi:hypothetical protein